MSLKGCHSALRGSAATQEGSMLWDCLWDNAIIDAIVKSWVVFPSIQWSSNILTYWLIYEYLKCFAYSRSFSADQGCNVNLNLNLCVLNLCWFLSSFSTQELVSGCSACIMVIGLVIFCKFTHYYLNFIKWKKVGILGKESAVSLTSFLLLKS